MKGVVNIPMPPELGLDVFISHQPLLFGELVTMRPQQASIEGHGR